MKTLQYPLGKYLITILFTLAIINTAHANRCFCTAKDWVGTCTASVTLEGQWLTLKSSSPHCSRIDWYTNEDPHVSIVTEGQDKDEWLGQTSSPNIHVESCYVCKDSLSPTKFCKATVQTPDIGQYEGQCRQGIPHGNGRAHYQAAGGHYEGEFHWGKIQGKGQYTDKFGNVYTGDWVDNVKQGKGKIQFKNGDTYEGEFQNNAGNGYGVYHSQTYGTYIGEWKNDIRTGKGEFIFPNGNRFKGDVRNNQFHGQGELRWVNGDIYIGTFVNGKQQGKGRFTYGESGDVYNGDFVDGLRHGQGTHTSALWGTYKGQWKNDKRTYGTMRYSNGNVYEGEFVNEVLQGQGTYRWENGDVYKGQFRNGKMNGQGTLKMANGDKFIGNMKDSNIDTGWYYYANGKRCNVSTGDVDPSC